MEKSLLITCALLNVGFAVFHMGFWRLFRWREQLAKLDWANRAIMQVMNIRLIYVFLMFAALQWQFADAMLDSPLGLALLAGVALFWFMRACEQALLFRLRHVGSKFAFGAFLITALTHTAPLLIAFGSH
jgi:hypothetical protein